MVLSLRFSAVKDSVIYSKFCSFKKRGIMLRKTLRLFIYFVLFFSGLALRKNINE